MFKFLDSNLFKNISSLTLIQLGNYVIPLLLVPYISRIVGIDNYGKLEYARTVVMYFVIISDYGFNLTATRAISINRDNKDKINKIVSSVFIAKILLFIVSTIAFYLLLEWNDNLTSNKLLLWSTFLIIFGNFLFPIWFFQGIEKIATIAYINFIIKLSVLASAYFLIKTSADYWKYNLLLSLAQIFIGLYSMYIVFVKYKVKFVTIKFKAIFFKYKEGFHVFVTAMLVAVFVSYAFLLLKETSTDTEIGAYSTAHKLAMIIQVIILLPFSQAFFPFITKKAKESIITFDELIKKAALIIFGITLLASIFSFIFAELIITLLFGKDFLVAVPIFKILAFLPVFTILNNLFSYQGLLSLHKDKLFLYIHVFFTIIILIISYIIVPKYGLMSVAYIRVISEIALMLVSYYFLKKEIRKKMTNE